IGTSELDRKCQDISMSDEYKRISRPEAARAAGTRMNGTLLRVGTGRDYGFIRGADGKDYFVFRTALRSRLEWEDLWDREPLPVQFLPGERPAGSSRAPKAQEVVLTELPTG